MQEVKAPNDVPTGHQLYVFMAGSIEMGVAEDWQTRFIEATKDVKGIVLNPRRDEWDASWEQSIENPEFREQVEWEMAGLERSHIVIFYFDPNTKAPITLLELGLIADTMTQVIVCCPPGYWRKGNVDIVCRRHSIPVVKTFDDLVAKFRQFPIVARLSA